MILSKVTVPVAERWLQHVAATVDDVSATVPRTRRALAASSVATAREFVRPGG